MYQMSGFHLVIGTINSSSLISQGKEVCYEQKRFERQKFWQINPNDQSGCIAYSKRKRQESEQQVRSKWLRGPCPEHG